jgi:Asp-tRNA(Asn)/Glu-tRNA(Gln) amidotransferase A subunit family amidase
MESCAERDLVREDILRQMGKVGLLLSPVSSAPAFRHGAGNYRTGDLHNYRDTMRFCQWLNLTGFPGVSLPMGRSPEGLPINVQLIGQPYEEEILLSVAEKLEQARGAWQGPGRGDSNQSSGIGTPGCEKQITRVARNDNFGGVDSVGRLF